ncbi:hypothetical protein N7481_009908 [Penicillium waksmanii]|uniref:uncharacterized protein n=1 Tax=Penicillium waksmanii TaxID=69791 RepID=UPI002548E8D6|nr:uncharacterized protein N7481_009908 [Penicillium waksmanii]KAJ5976201.1 hypothetical protein N7481_009908 [Penicillium waksmanii]
MQITKSLILLAACATAALSVATSDTNAASECKDLGGAMSVQDHDLPSDVSQADVRKCVEHPHGHDRGDLNAGSLAPFGDEEKKNPTSSLTERAADACYNAAPYGCSKGYCWASCGDKGEWCWTARKGGYGAWYTCKTFHDCGYTGYSCGRGGVSGGCSC